MKKLDITKLNEEDLKTLVLEHAIAGFRINEMIDNLEISRPRIYAILKADTQYGMQFRYAQHVVEVSLRDFIQLSNDNEKIELLKELCNYLPWALIIKTGKVIDECIQKLYTSLSTKNTFDLLEALEKGRTSCFIKLEELPNE